MYSYIVANVCVNIYEHGNSAGKKWQKKTIFFKINPDSQETDTETCCHANREIQFMNFHNWTFLFYVLLYVSIGPKTLGMLGKHTATKPFPQPSWSLFKWKPPQPQDIEHRSKGFTWKERETNTIVSLGPSGTMDKTMGWGQSWPPERLAAGPLCALLSVQACGILLGIKAMDGTGR